jgi:hypothetical protein
VTLKDGSYKICWRNFPTKNSTFLVLPPAKYVALNRREYLKKAGRIFKGPTNFVGEFLCPKNFD